MNVSALMPGDTSPVAFTENPKVESRASAPFAEVVNDIIQQADQQQHVVTKKVDALTNGGDVPLQQIAINVAKAELSFRFVMELRDRLIANYQEIMRMQI